MELANLKVYDPDAERGTIMIRQGKGRKDRTIPIGEPALAWIAKYLADARARLLTGSDDGTLFLNDMGQPYERRQLTGLVRRYLIASEIGKIGGCHLFRHTVATLMLENGADIKVIQQLLGHVKITTTEIYTHVAINLLKQVYSATHPAAHLKRAEAAADLLAALDTEAEEEDDE
jgi:integrase/recombinase XerD